MTVQHESRSGKDRRMFDLYSKSATLHDRRWHRDRRNPMIDEDDVYEPDWEISDSELEEYARIPPDD